MDHFTPLPALAGGILIGLASVWLLAANGRIAGVSGILHGLVSRIPGDSAWRAELHRRTRRGRLRVASRRGRRPESRESWARAACGRRSARRVRRPPERRLHERPRDLWPRSAVGALAGRGRGVHGDRHWHDFRSAARNRRRVMTALLSAFGAGLLFGAGLWLSGMANPQKVLGFLDITGNWDPSLLLVMAGAVAVTLAAFNSTLKRGAPSLAPRFVLPDRKAIDGPLVAGAAIFGVGWGLGGYCPGPALTAVASLTLEPVVFVVAMIAGGLSAQARLRSSGQGNWDGEHLRARRYRNRAQGLERPVSAPAGHSSAITSCPARPARGPSSVPAGCRASACRPRSTCRCCAV